MNACSAVDSVSDGKNVFSDLLSVLWLDASCLQENQHKAKYGSYDEAE